ncbi:MAG: molybdopterin-binding protein [Rhodospirillales bacterium]
MPEARIYTAAIVIIGNEILSGRTQDANVAFLGQRLGELGIRLMEVRVVRDTFEAIGAAVNALRAEHDYVFTTGGIGPTHDDITSEAIARAFGLPFGRHPEADAILRAYYKPEDITEARMSMADTPEGAELIDNPISRAPGFRVENVYVLPGVPSILQVMFDGIADGLAGGSPVVSRSVAANLPEGRVAEPLRAIQDAWPAVEIGSYPFFKDGKLGASLVMRGADPAAVDGAAADVRKMIVELGGTPIEE